MGRRRRSPGGSGRSGGPPYEGGGGNAASTYYTASFATWQRGHQRLGPVVFMTIGKEGDHHAARRPTALVVTMMTMRASPAQEPGRDRNVLPTASVPARCKAHGSTAARYRRSPMSGVVTYTALRSSRINGRDRRRRSSPTRGRAPKRRTGWLEVSRSQHAAACSGTWAAPQTRTIHAACERFEAVTRKRITSWYDRARQRPDSLRGDRGAVARNARPPRPNDALATGHRRLFAAIMGDARPVRAALEYCRDDQGRSGNYRAPGVGAANRRATSVRGAPQMMLPDRPGAGLDLVR